VTTPSSEMESLRRLFDQHGQAHVFAFWDRLTPPEQTALLAQTRLLAPTLGEWCDGSRRALQALATPAAGAILPAPAIQLPEHGGNSRRLEEARRRGQETLNAGRVGIFVVAGGQGTRLGAPSPKGTFPVGPVTSRSLFEIQAQKIRGLARRIGRRVPWYVMTSPATDPETRAFFEESSFFGLDPSDVRIFSQDMVPACDGSGRMLLESAGRIAESPNGHGGALLALCDSGALADMAERGIDRVFYYQVDNPLIRVADPEFIGFHELERAEMSCKVIRKLDPMEKVGVVASIDGRIGVVEYTELADRERNLQDEAGQLVYWAGSIAIHVFNTDFIERVRAEAALHLPYHASAKPIPAIDASGLTVASDEPNGYKLERFVFDALPAAKRVCVLEVRTEEEFSPIKNATGKDSPESARRDLDRLYRGWLHKAGVEVGEDVAAIEIDHTQIDSAEEAAASGIARIEDAGEVIRVATGMDA
jgi:UDP-N-acetylglucosamine/UDP-N-acetylgalactosamine diphosphorylase